MGFPRSSALIRCARNRSAGAIMTPMHVLIVSSGNPRGTLAAARDLSRAGWTVSVGSADTSGLVSWAKSVHSMHPVPQVERGLDAFLTATADAIHASGAEVVLPGSDAELLALSAARERVPAIVPLAEDRVVRDAVDKLELFRTAERAGLPTPKTLPAEGDAFERVRYPAVVKSRFHWLPEHAHGAPARLNAKICGDATAARAAARTMSEAGGEPLLQDILEGDPVNVHVVTDRDGTVLSMVQQDSPRLFYTPGAGSRVRSVTVPVDPALEASIPKLMKDLGWFGFTGLAFLRDAEGVASYIDFNGRLSSSMEASQGAGANYLAVWLALATERPVPPIGPLVMGKRYHYLEGDVRRAFHERNGGLARDLAGALAWAPGAEHTISKWDEPLVSLRYLRHIVSRAQPFAGLKGPLARLGRPLARLQR